MESVSVFTPEQAVRLTRGAEQLGLALGDATMARFRQLAELLDEANRSMNLTRVPAESIVELHFLDSLALAAVSVPEAGSRLMDVGTGAGFPGLPLALAFPGVHVTLVDATRKRVEFVGRAAAELCLTNVTTLHARAEEIGRTAAHHERYDVVTARAVTKLPRLVTWMLPLTRRGGLAVAYKSRSAGDEIAAAAPIVRACGGVIEQVVEVTLPGSDIVRKLVTLRKARSSPSSRTYRRRVG